MLSPTAAGVRVPGSPEEVRSAGETNMSREENKSKFGGRLGYILNDSTALPRVTFSNGLIRPSVVNGRPCCDAEWLRVFDRPSSVECDLSQLAHDPRREPPDKLAGRFRRELIKGDKAAASFFESEACVTAGADEPCR